MTEYFVLDGRQVRVSTGSGFQICTIKSGCGRPFPFRARSQKKGFEIYFKERTAKKLRRGKASNMKLL